VEAKEIDTPDFGGYPMTGRDARLLIDLITENGDGIWQGPTGEFDRGDRHSSKTDGVILIRFRRQLYRRNRGELT
jgi:hypothetical protein